MKKIKLKILVLAGGLSSEYKVSLRTAQTIIKNLDVQKYETSLAIIKKDKTWSFYPDVKSVRIEDAVKHLVSSRFDFVFIAIHGFSGEDGRTQALLEWLDMPYAGSGILSSAMAMDKEISNVLYKANGLLVPRYFIFDQHSEIGKINLKLPLVVKPANGGSSIGISIARTKKELMEAINIAFGEDNKIMIQEYIRGREFTCGVLEGRDGKPFVLPPTEIIPKGYSFFDYQAKYKVKGSLEITPARLPMSKFKELQKLALMAHKILECRGMSRSDFILKGSKFYILETNTIPGMTETSLLPKAAKVAGINFPEFLDLIIESGLRRE